MSIERVVVWFSAGVTSAVAAKITADKYRNVFPVHLVNTDTGSEDDDNYRFMDDVSSWIGIPLEIIRNDKYVDTFAVYDESKFFKNQHGAKCTVELKMKPKRKYENVATDLQVLGFDSGEESRARKFVANNPEVMSWFPLIEAGIDKRLARQMLMEAGIKEPRTYAEGFRNANCLRTGCVKGGLGYWNFMRTARPDVFARMAAKEREIGYALNHYEKYINKTRVKIPVYLDELDPNIGNYKAEPGIQCGLFCGSV